MLVAAAEEEVQKERARGCVEGVTVVTDAAFKEKNLIRQEIE